ncbi:hypothetical protein EMIHUDRAFT_224426 [Emiliania huxleyi CCMP1516]|uniref:Glutaredoxin domain-containing protein n=2 Tax=Emiliania huxleyi TaxID=2903 RepID=A0A0D3KSA0_EMIH1|nr:hypothetical protein EMIHUDRAFT_224426 [Emiliania huxleyi CCMP1516]EOD38635.1 hypothetical protein EMIHUDRAFT_224426 [Emiliania huxleyi CCMP1516]|eukprot:XP_005791064.1 hypothetical protein EMIHUDRAFT_224426 [Emiliania huxleyi CCMP1516]
MLPGLILAAAATRGLCGPSSLAARAPCPRRQLLSYVAFTAGRGAAPTPIHALVADVWQPVGHLAAGTPEAADWSVAALVRAATLQRRLIAEHACRLYPPLRTEKREHGLMRGVRLAIEAPPPSAGGAATYLPLPDCELGEATPAEMLRCGFAGAPGSGGGIYADYARRDSPPYDWLAVRRRLAEQTKAVEEEGGTASAFTLVAWPRCGFCTKARAELEARGIAYRHVVVDKYSPEHAELAMSTGRPSALPEEYFRSLDYAAGGVPWDLLGRPQPPVRNAFDEGAFGRRGTVILDCGCGAGDNANWLAERGHDVVGFDVSLSAVEMAQARAASVSARISAAGGATEFVAASATDLAGAARVQARASELGGFEVALDSAMLHCLDDDSQRAFVDGLRPLMRAGGKLFVGCFSDANPDPWSNPRRISESQLRSLLSTERGWHMVSLTSSWYERPSDRAASGRGAWTMAWWCVAEAVPVPGE